MSKIGDIVTMSSAALENYGEKWDGVELRITHKATAYMPAKDFFSKGKPKGFHPGYDEGTGGALFDLEVDETGEPLNFSLYEWEIQ